MVFAEFFIIFMRSGVKFYVDLGDRGVKRTILDPFGTWAMAHAQGEDRQATQWMRAQGSPIIVVVVVVIVVVVLVVVVVVVEIVVIIVAVVVLAVCARPTHV